jgi:hypothetical protein
LSEAIVTLWPACGTLPPQVAGSDQSSAPVIDDAEAALDAIDETELDLELDTELDNRDELEDGIEEI